MDRKTDWTKHRRVTPEEEADIAKYAALGYAIRSVEEITSVPAAVIATRWPAKAFRHVGLPKRTQRKVDDASLSNRFC